MVISVSHLTDQVEITGGGHARILSAVRGPAFPPAGPPTPVAASDSCPLTPLRGYDDPFQFQRPQCLTRGSHECKLVSPLSLRGLPLFLTTARELTRKTRLVVSFLIPPGVSSN